jgi:hypothetical protein
MSRVIAVLAGMAATAALGYAGYATVIWYSIRPQPARPIDRPVAGPLRPALRSARAPLVMGAVTQPWRADVAFRALPPEEFAAFSEPGYVKIAWTLRADPIGPSTSVFRTETRAIATDSDSRVRFRRYWAFLSPGILLIRYELLRLLETEAERRRHAAPAMSGLTPLTDGRCSASRATGVTGGRPSR